MMTPLRSRTPDRAHERFVSFGIEVGIRLVENHQEWIAVDGAGERDPLRLPGG